MQIIIFILGISERTNDLGIWICSIQTFDGTEGLNQKRIV